MKKLVLLRHGQSLWNQENRFTGWTDVDLSEQGVAEAKAAGVLLLKHGFTFDIAYTSVLKRAIRTAWIVLSEMDQLWVPVYPYWQLNERHYGSLQGLDKAQTAQKYGADQVMMWRRSYNIPPPALNLEDPRYPGFDRRYKNINPASLPLTECLKDTVARVIPVWEKEIAPALYAGNNILMTTHNNTLRALIKHLDNIADDEIVNLEIPTGIPLVYELTDELVPIRYYYLNNLSQH